MLHAVIMAGGAGTRFWPASRRLLPKQMLPLGGARTMIQATLDRLEGMVTADRVLVMTNRMLVDGIREQLPELPVSSILGEPCKRDTAPCIGLAAALIGRHDADATMIVMPSDQLIEPRESFQAALHQACELVELRPGRIVTFGIRPTYPAETFGYIERAAAIPEQGSSPGPASAYRVAMFREKPNAATARTYLESGRFYWNSGIFVWKARTILDAIRRYEPQMYAELTAIAEAAETSAFDSVLEDRFAQVAAKSIDYAVMERHDDVIVLEAVFSWDDVGSWGSLTRSRKLDEQGNAIEGRHVGVETRGCIVWTDPDHLVVTLGMENCIVVHTPDATLVARRSDEESIRKIVAILQEQGWTQYL